MWTRLREKIGASSIGVLHEGRYSLRTMNSDAARGVELGLYQGLQSCARAGYRSHASNNLKTDEETGASAINRIQVQHIPDIRGWTAALVDSDDVRAWRGRHVAPSAHAKARSSRPPMQ